MKLKKIINVVIIALLYISVNISAQTIHNISTGTDYLSINRAITNAHPGDIIRVDTGNYNEQIIFYYKTNITVEASDWFSNQNNNSTVLSGSNVKFIASKNCTLRGFTIINGDFGGIIIQSGSYYNIIENNIITTNNTGIYIQSGADTNIIKNNTIGKGQDFGIDLNGNNNSIISNKIISHIYDGITINSSAAYNEILNNNIISNGRYGIYVNGSTTYKNLIRKNIIKDNNSYGIYVYYGEYPQIYYNLLINNGNGTVSGIYLNTAINNAKIVNNVIFKSGADGIELSTNCTGIEIYNNIILSNSHYGINVSSATNVFIKYNLLWGNGYMPPIYSTGASLHTNINYFIEPLIDTTSNFAPLSDLSPVVDRGTNYSDAVLSYEGNGPDIGWIEYTGTGLLSQNFSSNMPVIAGKWNLKGISSAPLDKNFLDEIKNNFDSGLYYTYTWNADKQEYEIPDSLERGKGFWIYTTQPGDMEMPGDYISSGTFTIILKKGWNLISSPFPFYCDNLKISTNNIGGYEWGTASSLGIVDNRIWGWNSEKQTYEVVSMLQPWEGYWVYAEKDNYKLNITGEEQGGYKNTSYSLNITSLGFRSSDLPKIKWLAKFSVSANGINDNYNFAGSMVGASDEIKNEDSFKAPLLPGKNVRVILDNNLSYDIKAPVKTIKTWDIKVKSDFSYKTVLFKYDLTEIEKYGLKCILVDNDTGKIVTKGGNGCITIEGNKYGVNKNYILKVATPEYSDLLTGSTTLKDVKAYPNPINLNHYNNIKIGYKVSEKSKIDITIYSITGEKIINIVAGYRETGGHKENVDISSLNSGIYIYEIKAKGEESNKTYIVRGRFVILK